MDYARLSSGGLSDFQGKALCPGLASGLQLPAFIIVMLLTMILVRGIRESPKLQRMVLLKLWHPVFISFASRFIIRNWHPFAPTAGPGSLRRLDRVFHLYRLRFVSTRPKNARTQDAMFPSASLRLWRSARFCMSEWLWSDGLVPWQTLVDDAAPSSHAKKVHFGGVRLVVLIGALMGMISSLLVFQIGSPRMVRDVRDGLLRAIFSRVHPRFCLQIFPRGWPDFSWASPPVFWISERSRCRISALCLPLAGGAGVLILRIVTESSASLPRAGRPIAPIITS